MIFLWGFELDSIFIVQFYEETSDKLVIIVINKVECFYY